MGKAAVAQFEFAIVGAGAMGSIIGAHLARAGHAVGLLARDPRATQLERDGVRIKGIAEFTVRIPIIKDPTALRSAEVLIVATKAIGTAAVLAPLKHAEFRVAFSIQNGLMKNELLSGIASQAVLGALANISGELLPGGEVLFTRNVAVLLGEPGAIVSPPAQAIAAAIDASGVRARAVEDIADQEWSKFAIWLGLAALSVTTRRYTWQFLSDPGGALLLAEVIREVGTLANACGANLISEPPFRVGEIARASDQDAVEVIVGLGREFHSGAPSHRVSTLQDLERGRPLEIEETVGYALRKARALQLRLPLIEYFYQLLSAIDRTQQAPVQ